LARTGLLDQVDELRSWLLVLEADPKDPASLALAFLGVMMIKCDVPRHAVTKALRTFKASPIAGGQVVIFDGRDMAVMNGAGPLLVCQVGDLQPLDPDWRSPPPLVSTVFSLDQALAITRG
jgi:hypothetical protein